MTKKKETTHSISDLLNSINERKQEIYDYLYKKDPKSQDLYTIAKLCKVKKINKELQPEISQINKVTGEILNELKFAIVSGEARINAVGAIEFKTQEKPHKTRMIKINNEESIPECAMFYSYFEYLLRTEINVKDYGGGWTTGTYNILRDYNECRNKIPEKYHSDLGVINIKMIKELTQNELENSLVAFDKLIKIMSQTVSQWKSIHRYHPEFRLQREQESLTIAEEARETGKSSSDLRVGPLNALMSGLVNYHRNQAEKFAEEKELVKKELELRNKNN